jgi:hypothetical protein
MRLFEKLAQIADTLDQCGHIELASKIDTLIKEAKELNDRIVRDRFWAKVDKTPSCHLWNGAIDSSGYGILTINGKNHNAHRLNYEWATGKPIPKGLVLLHKCDQRNCVNDQHLSLGTQNENIADRVKKNRSAKGPQNGRARLKPKDIKKIRKLRSKGWTETRIAKLYGVGRSTIAHICKRHTWNWLND